jgi:hypothetical protein
MFTLQGLFQHRFKLAQRETIPAIFVAVALPTPPSRQVDQFQKGSWTYVDVHDCG